jgi:Ca2+-binding EF-hand superfamily protein
MSINSITGVAGGWGLMQMQGQAMRQAMFKQLDQDSNGSISESDLQKLAQNISQTTGESFDVDKIFTAVDTNEDGAIDQSEYNATLEQFKETLHRQGGLQGLGHHHHHSPESESGDESADPLLALFQQLDQDSDGSISESEFQTGLDNLAQSGGPGQDLSKLFAVLDANQDGSIDQSEQAAAQGGMEGQPPPGPPPVESPIEIAKAMFQQMDQDGDGMVSQSEFQAGLQNLARSTGTAADNGQTAGQAASSATGQENGASTLTQRLLHNLILMMQNDAYLQASSDQSGVTTYA